MTAPLSRSGERIEVQPWPSEEPLFVVAAVVSAVVWIAAIVSVVGLVYAAFAAAVFFLLHLAFVARVRGNGVRLGPDQFPDLYASVDRLARRLGLERVPDAYVMQAGGALNAFATRFLGSNIVVLYSDLLEACGDNTAARDMIIAHELGHIRAGHLRWQGFLMPSMLVPFLGSALSRAREYTGDRFGLAGAGDREGALIGLTILAAGGTHGPRVNRDALVRQRADLDTGWMTIGQWLASHPPLAKRVAELDPAFVKRSEPSRAALRAAGIIGVGMLPFVAFGALAASKLPAWVEQVNRQAAQAEAESYTPPPEPVAMERTRRDFRMLASFIDDERSAGRTLPANALELYKRWVSAHPDEDEPIDPFDGQRYGYDRHGNSYVVWSSGPDQKPNTEDDLLYDSRSAASDSAATSAPPGAPPAAVRPQTMARRPN